MRLTLYTDYSLRVLLYLAKNEDKMVTITELADFYKISRNHLVKVVHNLGIKDYLITTRGRKGGIKLARPAKDILIGTVVKSTEPDFDLLECFNPATDKCIVSNACSLKHLLFEAKSHFLAVLNQHTLADMAGTAPQKTTPLKPVSIVKIS
ncbi:MAG: Rrf2 family transcriptional regulator [Gallionella sp.]